MPRRRRMPEYVDNTDRWLVSYADFMTLLFAFFVVMYSTTRAGGDAVTTLSSYILEAFHLPGRIAAPAATPTPVPNLITADEAPGQAGVEVPLRPLPLEVPSLDATPSPDDGANVLLKALQEELEPFAVSRGVELRARDIYVEIDIPSSMVFPAGSRVLLNNAVPVLRRIAEGLNTIPNEVRIEVHTDGLFIDNGRFASNWDLSTSRAAVLAQVLQEVGVAPQRLSATGYGGFRPVAENESEEGRAMNRRLILRIPVLESEAAGPRRSASRGQP